MFCLWWPKLPRLKDDEQFLLKGMVMVKCNQSGAANFVRRGWSTLTMRLRTMYLQASMTSITMFVSVQIQTRPTLSMLPDDMQGFEASRWPAWARLGVRSTSSTSNTSSTTDESHSRLYECSSERLWTRLYAIYPAAGRSEFVFYTMLPLKLPRCDRRHALLRDANFSLPENTAPN